jgi:C-5 cytosine-specific DNA methylase
MALPVVPDPTPDPRDDENVIARDDSGITLYRTRLEVPEGTPLQAIESFLATSIVRADALQWGIGDAIVIAGRRYGKTYALALKKTDFSPGHLRNLASVASRVPPGNRRPDLSWTHHCVAARLEPDEQKEWLARARDEGWNAEELRMELGPRAGAERVLGRRADRDLQCLWLRLGATVIGASLFCGCGGSSLGLAAAGVTMRFACDKDRRAAETYELNTGLQVFCCDIWEMTAAEMAAEIIAACGAVPDYVDASPPCNPFTQLGRRDLDSDDAKLYMRTVEIALALMPPVLAFENVLALVRWGRVWAGVRAGAEGRAQRVHRRRPDRRRELDGRPAEARSRAPRRGAKGHRHRTAIPRTGPHPRPHPRRDPPGGAPRRGARDALSRGPPRAHVAGVRPWADDHRRGDGRARPTRPRDRASGRAAAPGRHARPTGAVGVPAGLPLPASRVGGGALGNDRSVRPAADGGGVGAADRAGAGPSTERVADPCVV